MGVVGWVWVLALTQMGICGPVGAASCLGVRVCTRECDFARDCVFTRVRAQVSVTHLSTD